MTTEDNQPVEAAAPAGGIQAEARRPLLQRMHPLGFAALLLAVVFVLYQGIGGGIMVLLFGLIPGSEQVGAFRLVTIAGQLVFILLPALLLAKLRYGEVRRSMRISLPGAAEIFVAVAAVFSLQQVFQGYMLLQDSIPWPAPLQQLLDQIRALYEKMYLMLVGADSIPELIAVVLTAALVPALCEEFLFRGAVQRSLEEAAGGARAAILTGIIFGAYHLNPLTIVPLVALGIFFGYLVYRSQSITLAVTAHFFNNFIACVATYLNLSEEFVAIAPSGEPPVGMLIINTSLFGVVFVAAVAYLNKLTADRPRRP